MLRVKINTSRGLALTAIIAAMYAVVTIFAPIPQYQAVQVRFADALSILAFFFGPVGVAGMTLGCFVANVLSPYGVLDMVIGTLSTLVETIIVAYIGYKTPKEHFKRNLVSAQIIGSVIVGAFIAYLLNFYGIPLEFGFVTVTIGELISKIAIGVPLAYGLRRTLPSLFTVGGER